MLLWQRYVVGFFLILLSYTAVPLSAYAEAQDPMEAQHEVDTKAKKDEYDFSWLDPEKKIYVVQNRKYSNANRFEGALGAGIGFGEAYRKRTIFFPRAIYYFNDSWGIGLNGGFVGNSVNENFLALKSVSSVVPTVRDVSSFYGPTALWMPFYGKINMFNQILYMDWHFEAGIDIIKSEIDLNTQATGASNLVSDTQTGLHWGTGMKFFITKNIAARLDFLGLYFSAPKYLKGDITDKTTSTYTSYFFTLGASYTF